MPPPTLGPSTVFPEMTLALAVMVPRLYTPPPTPRSVVRLRPAFPNRRLWLKWSAPRLLIAPPPALCARPLVTAILRSSAVTPLEIENTLMRPSPSTVRLPYPSRITLLATKKTLEVTTVVGPSQAKVCGPPPNVRASRMPSSVHGNLPSGPGQRTFGSPEQR